MTAAALKLLGHRTAIEPNAFDLVRANETALRQLRTDLRTGQSISPTAANAFNTAVGGTASSPQATAEQILEFGVRTYPGCRRVAISLRCGAASKPPTTTQAPRGHCRRQPFRVCRHRDALEATEGLLAGLSSARGSANTAPLPLRAHLFFRNLQGLWACTDPACSQAPPRTGLSPTGRLHYVPTLTCGCGSRVLELLYCEACGEVLFGGYRRETGLNNNEWYLSPDHPDLEASPDMASFDRNYLQYAVYWPAPPGAQPASPQWTQDGVPRAWRSARFTPGDGKVQLGGPGFLYYVPSMHGANPPPGDSANQAYPARCPRCDADWSRRQIGSPIRTLRTGFQKIAQVLSDALLRDISGTQRKSAPKTGRFLR